MNKPPSMNYQPPPVEHVVIILLLMFAGGVVIAAGSTMLNVPYLTMVALVGVLFGIVLVIIGIFLFIRLAKLRRQ